jgi:rubrerythrin
MSDHDSHHHHSNHHHGHEKISDQQKLVKMMEHWIHHNQDHAHSYYEWAKRAKDMGWEQVAGILEEVAEQAMMQNRSIEQALALMKEHGPESKGPETLR